MEFLAILLRDQAHGSEELGQLALPLLHLAGTGGRAEQFFLGFQVEEFIGVEVEIDQVRAVILPGPVQIELLELLDDLFARGGLEPVNAAQVEGQEGGGHVGVLRGVGGVGHQHDGQMLAHVLGRAHGLPAALVAHKGERRPEHHGVADIVVKGGQGRGLLQILEDDVRFLQAQSLQPEVQGIIGGGHAGAEDGLAAHAFRTAVHIGVVLVVALGLQNGAVSAHHDRIGHGLVVAQPDDAHIVAQRAQHGRHGPQPAKNPASGRESAQGVGAGIKGVNLQVNTGGFVPTLLFGVPDGEGLLAG